MGYAGPMADQPPFDDDYDDLREPTEAEQAGALEHFLADGGRFPGVADELRRARQAEIDADYPDEDPATTRPARREPASIEGPPSDDISGYGRAASGCSRGDGSRSGSQAMGRRLLR